MHAESVHRRNRWSKVNCRARTTAIRPVPTNPSTSRHSPATLLWEPWAGTTHCVGGSYEVRTPREGCRHAPHDLHTELDPGHRGPGFATAVHSAGPAGARVRVAAVSGAGWPRLASAAGRTAACGDPRARACGHRRGRRARSPGSLRETRRSDRRRTG